ncbi:putative 5,10-methylenetetrahydrofolate reductase [Candidatus Carsonella ruddii HT isolate Thao2000]|uniref:Methylenetetrahydrofolate reductase n=1 Tax=Candidatus Carsonella ruddii HT isolate Thao2000 TaxID=1202539 RepID=J3TED9_CARRU|nr:methylenetetrahydrofolate reductase [Candidatus Carsonella ruddii]AFP84062.1 putative 5,10-methylenetetrahydrofolate reductase [Candidatus Carsonella ruddii HT isolate Thao2000]
MKHISFEIFPIKNIKENILFFNYLLDKNPKFITVTCGKKDNYDFIKKIKSYINKKIIPHIICNDIFLLIKKIIKFINLKIFEFVVITGDNSKFNSFNIINKIRILFGHTIKIYSGIYLEEHKITKNILNEILFIYKKKKIGINMFISQFFYNYNLIEYCVNILKKIGINKNIILGIFPKKNIKEILYFTNKCKIELPIWIIKNFNYINFKNYYFKNIKKIKMFHFYTFNKKKYVEYYLK